MMGVTAKTRRSPNREWDAVRAVARRGGSERPPGSSADPLGGEELGDIIRFPRLSTPGGSAGEGLPLGTTEGPRPKLLISVEEFKGLNAMFGGGDDRSYRPTVHRSDRLSAQRLMLEEMLPLRPGALIVEDPAIADLRRQHRELAGRMARWIFDHGEQIDRAFIELGDDETMLYLLVSRSPRFDRQFNREAARLGSELARDPSLDRVRVEITVVPNGPIQTRPGGAEAIELVITDGGRDVGQ